MFKAVLLEVAIRHGATATRVEAVVVEVGSHGLVIAVPAVSDYGFRAAGNWAIGLLSDDEFCRPTMGTWCPTMSFGV